MIDRYDMDRTPMIVYFVGPLLGAVLGVLGYDFMTRTRQVGTPELGGIEKSAVESR